ncbi:hypothetical protein AAY81_00850 [Denitrobacterium detoxificans]|nr:hypothetical protein AAY81_00850 [Denitrobacterium detoxificans]
MASERFIQKQPVFYVIRDYRLEIVPDGYGDIIRYTDSDDHSCDYSPREAIESIVEDEIATIHDIETSEEGEDFGIKFTEDGELDPSVSEDNCCWFLDTSEFAEHLTHHTLVKKAFIVPDTLFLTYAEAREHLRLNHYHYTKDAHTYAMTAWRSPQVSNLLGLLHSIDFDESIIKLKLDAQSTEGKVVRP